MREIKCYLFLLVFLLTMLSASSQEKAQRTHQSVGLVLSGGGAKGVAHVGVIKALEENHIPIDYIAGTSMGAIIGGLYACGYTTDEMLELLGSEYFANMSTGTLDPQYVYYFTRQARTPQMFSVNLGTGKRKDDKVFNPQSLIAPMPMDFAFMELFAAYTSQCQGDFDKLFVPFRCVASDVKARRKKVLSGGNVGDAIHASMSFPLVFQPTVIDGSTLYDGGIYDNFPVDVMEKDFAPDFILGIDVSTPDKEPLNSYMDQLDLLIMQPQSYAVDPSTGMKIHIDLTRFGLLDFPKGEEICKIGYATAMSFMDSIKSRIHSRADEEAVDVKRRIFKAKTPFVRFDSVEVHGGSDAQNHFLAKMFAPKKEQDTIGLDHARLAFYRAISTGKYSMLRADAVENDSTGLYTLRLDSDLKKDFGLGFGGYITSSNNSYLYLRAGYSSLGASLFQTDLQAWIGQSYMAASLNGSFFMRTRIPSAIRYEAVASRRKFYEDEELFFKDNEPTFVVKHQYFGKVSYALAVGRRGRFELGIGGGKLYNTFFQDRNPETFDAGRSSVSYNLGQAFAAYTSSTLDKINYPTSGYSVSAYAKYYLGSSFYKSHPSSLREKAGQHFGELDIKGKNYFSFGRHWAFGIEGEAVFSNRKLFHNYYASISSAPGFVPTPSSANSFNVGFRANNFVAVGIVPVWKIMENLTARTNLHAYVPMRHIVMERDGSARYGRWLSTAEFFGELAVNYALPFANVTGYANYSTAGSKFNVGISFGIYLPAPEF